MLKIWRNKEQTKNVKNMVGSNICENHGGMNQLEKSAKIWWDKLLGKYMKQLKQQFSQKKIWWFLKRERERERERERGKNIKGWIPLEKNKKNMIP